MTSIALAAEITSRDATFELDVDDGEVVAILGPNGAGKSTLLSLVAGLLRPDSGRVKLGTDVVTDTESGKFVPAHARGVATLTQKALLFPHLSAEANVAFAPRSRGVGRRDARRIAREWLTAVDALELADRRPSQLSGGQAQRIAVARALAADPRVLLLDEPMSALDVGTAPAIRRLLRTVLREQRRTALIVTHDLLDALALADTVVVVDSGRIVERGTTTDVLTAPRSTFAARIAGINLLPGHADGSESLHTTWGRTVFGHGDIADGPAVAVFSPAAVAVHLEPPHASPRNVLPVTIAEMDVHGATVRLRGADNPDGSPGIAADVTPMAVAELDLEPGKQVYFVVKSHEVALHPASR
ncbi:sulfate/molybdate ABC transporter ATP-binding protein [Rhodococcoides kyotonense]|uniref:Molybdate transport system ATP-binding protein n=1 Tax=Rhodococcoides kyotonense TaxID=398843 RepID=A0A239D7Q0_9NOCA|nr:ATP-binding cassette domain-containing protein [Rhodococcus kyotonensis]SNS27904.1 molybdate transport system ATP-binding protein [Rhodococcus kyotonensis]